MNAEFRFKRKKEPLSSPPPLSASHCEGQRESRGKLSKTGHGSVLTSENGPGVGAFHGVTASASLLAAVKQTGPLRQVELRDRVKSLMENFKKKREHSQVS